MPRDGYRFQAGGAGGAPRQATEEALATLHGYIEGSARLFDVLDALRCIEYCCFAARGPCRVFRAALFRSSPAERDVLTMESLQQMERVILRADSAAAGMPTRNGSSPDRQDRWRAWGAA